MVDMDPVQSSVGRITHWNTSMVCPQVLAYLISSRRKLEKPTQSRCILVSQIATLDYKPVGSLVRPSRLRLTSSGAELWLTRLFRA